MRTTIWLLALALVVAVALPVVLNAEEEKKAVVPVELGAVPWLRDFDAAAKQSKRSEKPILLLFQEVPGWGTCKKYGRQVLTHPFIVDAAPALFVPVCIYNNTKGDDDEKVRKLFEEPAWNNPVVRIVDAKRKDIVPRVNNDWSLAGLSSAMVAALKAKKGDVPPYLDLLATEQVSRRRGVQSAAFAMTWFWVGDAQLGTIDGVIATEPGWLRKLEVVEVTYDPEVIAFEDLIAKAAKCECAVKVFTRSGEQQKVAKKAIGERAVRTDDPIRTDDDKYYLSRTPLKYLPMTSLQAARVNARVGTWRKNDKGSRATIEVLLAPSQRALLEKIEKSPDAGWESAIGQDFVEAWSKASEKARDL